MPVSGGTTDAITMPVISVARDAVVVAQIGDENAELVGSALANRGEPPAVHELAVAEHAEDDVGVADVDG